MEPCVAVLYIVYSIPSTDSTPFFFHLEAAKMILFHSNENGGTRYNTYYRRVIV